MRWSLLVAVFGLSIADLASFAEGPPGGERLSATRSPCEDAGFFASTGVVRFQLVQGRLFLDAPRHRKGSQTSDSDGIYESITVTADRGIPSLHYVFQSQRQHLTLNVQQATSMRIESRFPHSGERAVLEQPEFGELSWARTHGEVVDRYRGTNLLHLRHANAVNFDQHFGPLIQRLLQGQSLQALSDATERAMLRNLEAVDTRPDRQQIRECIEQLRADRRSTRVQAERQLLAWGTPIVPSLHEMIQGDVDAEQRERMRRILKRLRPMIDDTPATLAQLFLNDRSYWSRIATGLSGVQLHLANQHLQGFGIQPIELPSQPDHRVATTRD